MTYKARKIQGGLENSFPMFKLVFRGAKKREWKTREFLKDISKLPSFLFLSLLFGILGG